MEDGLAIHRGGSLVHLIMWVIMVIYRVEMALKSTYTPLGVIRLLWQLSAIMVPRHGLVDNLEQVTKFSSH